MRFVPVSLPDAPLFGTSPVPAEQRFRTAHAAARRVRSGRLLQQAVLTDVLKFVGYHLETDQLSGTEGRRNSDIGRVTSPRDHNAANPRMVVPRVKGEPATIQEYLIPCAKVHGGRIGRDADIAKIARAVPRRDVHAAGKRDGKVGEIPADTAAFLMTLRGGAVPPCVVVAELHTVVGVVTDRLRSLPTSLDAAKERPG